MKRVIGLLLVYILPAFCLAQTSANPNDIKVISATWHYAVHGPGNSAADRERQLQQRRADNQPRSIDSDYSLYLRNDRAAPVVTILNYGSKTIKEISYDFLFVDTNDGRVWLRFQFSNRTTIRAGETRTITNLVQDDRVERGLSPMVSAYRVIIKRVKYADGTVWRRR